MIGDAGFMAEHDGQTIPINKLFALNGEKFMGKEYVKKFGDKELTYLFKVLSVRTALSI